MISVTFKSTECENPYFKINLFIQKLVCKLELTASQFLVESHQIFTIMRLFKLKSFIPWNCYFKNLRWYSLNFITFNIPYISRCVNKWKPPICVNSKLCFRISLPTSLALAENKAVRKDKNFKVEKEKPSAVPWWEVVSMKNLEAESA